MFIHSTNMYVAGTILGIGGRVINETGKANVLLTLKSYWDRNTKPMNNIISCHDIVNVINKKIMQ